MSRLKNIHTRQEDTPTLSRKYLNLVEEDLVISQLLESLELRSLIAGLVRQAVAEQYFTGHHARSIPDMALSQSEEA